MSEHKKSGATFKTGNITAVGDVLINSVQAEGDIIGRDKVTTTTTTVTTGFKQETDKQNFMDKLEKLCEQLEKIKSAIESADSVAKNDRRALVAEIMQEVVALESAKEAAKNTPVGTGSPHETHNILKGYLESVERFLEKAQNFSEKAAEITIKLAPCFEKAISLLTGARNLFGLP